MSSAFDSQLIAFRRDMHQHPELASDERRATETIATRLRSAGLTPHLLEPTGVVVDVGDSGPLVAAFRADLDALPIPENTTVPWASLVPGVCHACGHDIHTTVVLGLALALARLHEMQPLAGRVRLIFQPAEEVTPGGAQDCLQQGVLAGVPRIFALHCDPRLEVGSIGSRIGAITSASDAITITVTGRGGHTSRPHLTEDIVYALGHLATAVPAVLGRRLDPRSGVSVVWGRINAGTTTNAIPSSGTLAGTMRCLDRRAWYEAGELLEKIVRQLAAPYGVEVNIQHVKGVPPVVNTEAEVALIERAARSQLGAHAVTLTQQSLGGEDFAWYLTRVPGAMIRLGARPRGATEDGDLHRGDLVLDEEAIGIGVRVFIATALEALAQYGQVVH